MAEEKNKLETPEKTTGGENVGGDGGSKDAPEGENMLKELI